VSGAYARGAEAAYHQQFYWLAKPFDGLGIDANVTVVDSRIQEYSAAASATGHAEYGLLPGTSHLTWNLAGFYEAHGFEARISAEYVSKELFSLSGVGGSKALDTIQDNRLTADFTASYRFLTNWKVYFSAKNLTDAPLRFYVNKPSLPIQREYYEQTFQLGIKAHF
jgi:outer membrane receptor protein involved in Fe transport